MRQIADHLQRFEIACYKNKVREWRTGVEKDIDEVVQIHSVFFNVSKGQTAPNGDLQKAFGTTDLEEIVLQILKKGELQVGEKERSAELGNLFREIATMVSNQGVDRVSQRPFTVSMIEKSMTEIGYSVKPGKSAKAQALDVMRQLQEKNVLEIERVKLRIRITSPNKDGKKLKEKVHPLVEKVESEEWDDGWELIATIDPGTLKSLNELLETETKGRGHVETLNTIRNEGEGSFD